MPKEWTDKIKAQEQQKKLKDVKIHNLPKEFEHQTTTSETTKRYWQRADAKRGEKILWKNVIKRGL